MVLLPALDLQQGKFVCLERKQMIRCNIGKSTLDYFDCIHYSFHSTLSAIQNYTKMTDNCRNVLPFFSLIINSTTI